jgi:hypothetical protein
LQRNVLQEQLATFIALYEKFFFLATATTRVKGTSGN